MGSTPKPRRRRRRRHGWRIGIALVVTYLLYGLLMLALQRWFLFPRHATSPHPETADRVAGLQQLWIDVPGGRVEAWLLPGDGVSASAPGPAVIFAHGNAELIEDWPDELGAYQRRGVSVLLPEYRGYGRSAGSPSQEAIAADLIRFFDLLVARPEVDRNRIVFHGRSLGGGAACALMQARRPRALILQSTFTSIRAMTRRFLLPGFLVRDPFDNLGVIERYDGPVLIFHGRKDNLVPHRHAEQLHAAARRSQLISYDRASHNDCPPAAEPFWKEIFAFLEREKIL